MRIATLLLLLSGYVLAQTTESKKNDEQHYHGVQQRGQAHEGMGFSQTDTTHHFILTADGGYIQVTANDPKDTASIEQIQAHFQHIAMMFAQGDFDIPHFVHAQNPPGVKTMQKLKSQITYTNQKLENGAKLVIGTKSPQAIGAVHDFLKFQITDHRTGDPLEVVVEK
jgi:hypothetical protein